MIPGWRKFSDLMAERGIDSNRADVMLRHMKRAALKYPGLLRQFGTRGHWYVSEEVAASAGYGELVRGSLELLKSIDQRLENVERKADEILENVAAVRVNVA